MSNPTAIATNQQPPKPWQPENTYYCVCCARILIPGQGPLLCPRCAGQQGLHINYCNICGAPLPLDKGMTTAHDICLRSRFAIGK